MQGNFRTSTENILFRSRPCPSHRLQNFVVIALVNRVMPLSVAGNTISVSGWRTLGNHQQLFRLDTTS